MTQQMIRRFQLAGQVKGDRLLQAKETLKTTMLYKMKSEGFVPVYDIDSVWVQNWSGDDVFDFVYTWQGVYVGKEKAWQTEGVSGGKTIPHTQKNKSPQS